MGLFDFFSKKNNDKKTKISFDIHTSFEEKSHSNKYKLMDKNFNDIFIPDECSVELFKDTIKDFNSFYTCNECGFTSVIRNYSEKNDLEWNDYECPDCHTISRLKTITKRDIANTYKTFLNQDFSFYVDDVKYGVRKRYFNSKFGGGIYFDFVIPFKGDDELKVQSQFYCFGYNSDFDLKDKIVLFAKSKEGFEYTKIQHGKKYYRENFYDTKLVMMYRDKDTVDKLYNCDVAIIENDKVTKICRDTHCSLNVTLVKNKLMLHIIYRNDNDNRESIFLIDSYKNKVEQNLDSIKLYNKNDELIKNNVINNISVDEYWADGILEQSSYINPLITDNEITFYFSYDYALNSRILFQYAKNQNLKIEELKNELDNDPTVNYKVIIPRLNLDDIFFYYYTIMKKPIKSYCIMGMSLNEILFVRGNTEETLVKITDDTDVCLTINKLIQSKLNLPRAKLIDYFCEKYGLFVVDNHFFNHRNNEAGYEHYGFKIFRSIHSDYMNAMSESCGFEKYDDFYISTKYKKFKETYNKTIKRIKENGIKSTYFEERELFDIVNFYFNDSEFQFELSKSPILRVDIFIPSIKLVIEYQGKQHYEKIRYFHDNNDDPKQFDKQLKRDSDVREICKKNNYKLLVWPYILNVSPLMVIERINEEINHE